MKRIFSVVVLVLVLGWAVGSFSGSDAAWAQDEPTSARQRTMWDTIKAGGAIEAVIILISVVGLALIIEHAVSIRREKLIPPYVLSELESLFDEEEYEEALDLCDQDDSMLCRIVGASLSKLSGGYGRMKEAADEVTEEETATLFQKISYLSLIAGVAPMLGLLGTVTGMIMAFNKIAAMEGAANPADLADGISQALVTTCTGLIVAIPVLSAYMIFRNRVIKLSLEATAICGELLERFRQAAG